MLNTMILQTLTVQNFGSIDRFSCDFTNGFNLIKSRGHDVLSDAIRLVLCHKAMPPFPTFRVWTATRIEATVRVNTKTYFVTVLPNAERRGPILKAHDSNGNDITAEYRYLCSHCVEQDLSDVFDGNEKELLCRFLQYANADLYDAPCDLCARTDGLSDIKAFRSYLRSFIKDFKPETIREGKRYEIAMDHSGKYIVQCQGDDCTPCFLSESEQTLFRYLCFLRTAEFWQGFEELRNLNGIKKPLLIENFLERLDEAIDVSTLLQRTAELGRQVILLY